MMTCGYVTGSASRRHLQTLPPERQGSIRMDGPTRYDVLCGMFATFVVGGGETGDAVCSRCLPYAVLDRLTTPTVEVIVTKVDR